MFFEPVWNRIPVCHIKILELSLVLPLRSSLFSCYTPFPPQVSQLPFPSVFSLSVPSALLPQHHCLMTVYTLLPRSSRCLQALLHVSTHDGMERG